MPKKQEDLRRAVFYSLGADDAVQDKLDRLLTLSPSAILKLDDKTFEDYEKARNSFGFPMKKGEKRIKRVIDEGSLTKTELRTLKSLRKTRGQVLGDKVFHMWQWARRRKEQQLKEKELVEREKEKQKKKQIRENERGLRASMSTRKNIELNLKLKKLCDLKFVLILKGLNYRAVVIL